MMLTPLPFSGLSLLVHLGIIALIAGASLCGFKRKHMKERNADGYAKVALTALKPLMSVLIIIFVGGITLLFIWTAIMTGIQSGANEPQRVLIESIKNII